MRTRMLLTASAVALAAASCAQPEPQVLSEPPARTTATDLSSATETTTTRESEPGRFIARCATEADGGTPGKTIFTDGSEGITDHCLSRYYIGVQPAPGALYVPHEDAGTYAPQRTTTENTDTETSRWTPAQPRTDVGPGRDEDRDRDDSLMESGDQGGADATETATSEQPTETPVEPTTPDETSTPPTTTPVDDEVTDPTEPTGPGESTEPTGPPTTTVPTITETPAPTEDPTPSTAVTSTEVPTAEAQSAPATQSTAPQQGQQTGRGGQGGPPPQQNPPAPGFGSFPGSGGSHGLPFPFGSIPQPGSAPTAVPTPGN